MSKLEFKPQDRQSIDFAEQERKESQTRGAVVHKNDTDIEKSENKTTYSQRADFSEKEYPSMSALSEAVRGYAFKDRYDFDSEEQFLDWVKNTAPQGCYTKFMQLGGSLFGVLIQKVSSSYAAVFRFSYGHGNLFLNRLVAGNWQGFQSF